MKTNSIIYFTLFLQTFGLSCQNESIRITKEESDTTKISKGNREKQQVESDNNTVRIGKSVIYTVYELGFDEKSELKDGLYAAVPIIIYNDNSYIEPPYCERINNENDAIKECQLSDLILGTYVEPGSTLYIASSSKTKETIQVKRKIDFGLSDWTRPSGVLAYKPSAKILSNNFFRDQSNSVLSDLPKLPKRKNDYGSYYSNELIGVIDINGDGLPECIYEMEDYEGVYYVVYTKINGKWKEVYSGAYNGV